MVDSILNIAFLAQVLRISIPYTLPALGATFSERGGVINIGLEGMLLMGAFVTTAVTSLTNDPLVGIAAGLIAGIGMGMIHGVASVILKVDQIIIGIALNLLSLGLTKFLCQVMFQSSSNSSRIIGIDAWTAWLKSIPYIGGMLENPFIVLAVALALGSHYLLFKTRYGLRLRAVGEHPEAADTLGISVSRMRYSGVLISGGMCGLGGAWLALDQHSFTDGMTAGRGFIALAAMIVGKWKPINATLACILFAFAEALVIQLQGGSVPVQFIQMIPYVLTMVVLVSFIGRAVPPAADGVPYEKEVV